MQLAETDIDTAAWPYGTHMQTARWTWKKTYAGQGWAQRIVVGTAAGCMPYAGACIPAARGVYHLNSVSCAMTDDASRSSSRMELVVQARFSRHLPL